MTRGDYIKIAEAMSSAHLKFLLSDDLFEQMPEEEVRGIVMGLMMVSDALCARLGEDNPRFSKEMFEQNVVMMVVGAAKMAMAQGDIDRDTFRSRLDFLIGTITRAGVAHAEANGIDGAKLVAENDAEAQARKEALDERHRRGFTLDFEEDTTNG